MPIYEYRCENGHQFDVMQKMSEEPLTTCSECGAPLHRVFNPVAIHFKGKGFHNTDYGTRKRQREQAAEKANNSSGGGESSSSSSSSESSSDSKSETKSADKKSTDTKAA